MTLLAFTLAAAALLAPGRDHHVLGAAIADRVDAELPLFKADVEKRKTAALLVAVLFREGSLGLHVEGDKVRGRTTSWCSAQINLSPGAKTREGWTGPELRDDADKCIAVAFRMLRDSVNACPRAPIALYAVGGAHACTSPRGIRISADRMALARRLLRDVAVTTTAATDSVTPAPRGLRTPIGATWRHADRLRAASVLGGAS